MKLIIIVITLLTLNGCSSIKPLEFFSKPIEKTPLNLKDPDNFELEDIKWNVITEANAEEVFKKLKGKNIDPVLIGLTDNDYEKLSVNMMKIRNYIIQYQFILKEYRNYYEDNVNDNKNENSDGLK
jgi:hypothetical protein|tara:strand:- start:41 stop:418 length:378 start_codon:yes stop_codon:yes gene_type:complete